MIGLLLAAVIASGVALMQFGQYGWTLFVLLPVFVGGIACLVRRPTNAGSAAGTGMSAVAIALVGLLLMGLDGLICIAMAAPLALPLGALGGWLIYKGGSSVNRYASSLLLLPAGVLHDVSARPPLMAVETSVEIAAPADKVWQHFIAFPEMPEPDDWFFRAGLAYPQRARLEGSGAGAIRYCEFSTGAFVEPIEVWDAPRLLRFGVTKSPAPMREWSPYADIAPKHLHGYFRSERGQFQLTPLPGNRTLLAGTTWYRNSLWPAPYWRLWSDAIISRIHLRVLTHIRALAE